MGKGKTAVRDTAGTKAAFLETYKVTGNAEMAVERMVKEGVSIARATVYVWIDKDEEFAKHYHALKDRRTEQIEDNMAAMALGTKDAKKSELIAGIFWLTHNKKEVYGGGRFGAGAGKNPGSVQTIESEEIIKDYSKQTIKATKTIKTITDGPAEDTATRLIEGEMNAGRDTSEDQEAAV